MADSLNTVSVHALRAGYLTLPEKQFIAHLEDENRRKTVPSLSFLIQHRSPSTGKATRLVFDLGIRREPDFYQANIRKHILTRQPLHGYPDVIESLALGGRTSSDVDFIILSHVHWDHVGMPSDFPDAQFVVGHGSLALLNGDNAMSNGSHSHFEKDLLPRDRTIELPLPAKGSLPLEQHTHNQSKIFRQRAWKPVGNLPHALDIFNDGSLYVVDAPGHLPGHINLLCRVSVNPNRYVYLAGDACHDRRILTGECEIASWSDHNFPGQICCIHADRARAAETIRMIRELEGGETSLGEVEVVLAHDDQWAREAEKQRRYFPGSL